MTFACAESGLGRRSEPCPQMGSVFSEGNNRNSQRMVAAICFNSIRGVLRFRSFRRDWNFSGRLAKSRLSEPYSPLALVDCLRSVRAEQHQISAPPESAAEHIGNATEFIAQIRNSKLSIHSELCESDRLRVLENGSGARKDAHDSQRDPFRH